MATSARLEELQQKFNENPRRYFAPLANEHRKLGDLDQAITLCRTHLPQQPQHVSGHIVLAQALFEAGNTPDARQTFELALDLDPENLIALRFLGDIARSLGDHATARQWYERVLDADPRNDEIARLVRDLENGAAALPNAVAEHVPASEPAITEPEPHVAFVSREPDVDTMEAPSPVTSEPLEDLATAWQHEVAALDAPSHSATPASGPIEAAPVSVEVGELPAEPAPEVEPVAQMPEPEPETFEPEAELVAQAAESNDAPAAAADTPAEPNEPWAEPDEAFVASVPTVEAMTPPAPPAFAEIDYSMFEAVADEEAVVASPPEQADATPVDESIAAEALHASGDDWFAIPAGREPEAIVVESATEASFDLDAAFQQVLPNKQESEVEEELAPQGPVADFDELPHSREWEVAETIALVSEEPASSASGEGPDSVDDAFAELDRMTASLDADTSGNAMLLPDEEYTTAEAPDVPQHVDALIGRTPESGVAAIESAPIAFVTETMAELYLQQGFREEALAVYRQLLAMNPSDTVLAARVHALEGSDAPTTPSEDAATSFESFRMAPAAHADAAGQSMRAFLGVFARRRAPMRRRERVAAGVPSVAPEPRTGLSALFGSTQGSDDGAAAVLAGAFAQPNADIEPLPGRPTRAAAQELSLGDVFSGSGGATNGGRAASFDEFFSTGTADQSVRSPLDEEGSDMEQFTAWLEGLKKK